MNRTARKMIAASAVIALCGCSADNAVRNTVDTFWNAMSAGEIEAAKELVSSELYESLDVMNSAADSLISVTDDMTLSEETQKVIDDFTSSVVKISYGNHKIISLQETGEDEYEAKVSVEVADPESLQSALSEIDYESQLEGYQDEIMEIMSSEGIVQAYSRMFEIIFAFLNEHLDEIASKVRYAEQTVSMKVVKTEGKWLITQIGEPEDSD